MPDPDIWENSLNGIETKVRLGESVGEERNDKKELRFIIGN